MYIKIRHPARGGNTRNNLHKILIIIFLVRPSLLLFQHRMHFSSEAGSWNAIFTICAKFPASVIKLCRGIVPFQPPSCHNPDEKIPCRRLPKRLCVSVGLCGRVFGDDFTHSFGCWQHCLPEWEINFALSVAVAASVVYLRRPWKKRRKFLG